MKKFWFGVGIVIITILLLLQTRFNIFLQLDNEGYAIRSNTVRSMLLTNPDEEVKEEETELYLFNPLDYIYTRAGSYYMGDDKKTQIDMSFPLYINGGAGLFFTDNKGTLFDVDYNTADVYQGLSVTGGVTYNPGGERADGIEFLFYGTGNGFFYNLKDFSFIEKGKEREVAANSAIYFTENYFSYCELEDEHMYFQMARYMTSNSKVQINGEEITYHELLVRLGVLSDKKNGNDKDKEDASKDALVVPTPDVNDTVNNEITADSGEAEKADKADKIKKEKDKKEKEDKDKGSSGGGSKGPGSSGSSRQPSSSAVQPGTRQPSSSADKPARDQGDRNNKDKSDDEEDEPTKPRDDREKNETDDSNDSTNEGEADTTEKGVRPDSMRPDKNRGDRNPAPEPGYVKPVVTFESADAGIYRIMVNMKVNDPASRIDKNRRVQFEFYEIDKDGNETLVYRTYYGSSGTVVAGNGNIKPDTNYRVNIFFSYQDEFNQTITESVNSEVYVKTKPLDLDALIKIRRDIDPESGVVYGTIPYYYDNYMEITNFTYDAASDEEALYGIGTKGGMVIRIKKDGISTPILSIIDSASIQKFKNGVLQDIASIKTLDPNSHYTYEITISDYFGNEFKNLENATGSFYTSKSRPVGTIEITNNVVGDLDFKLSLEDPDDSVIKAVTAQDEKDYDLYFVLSTEDVNRITSTKLYEQMLAYVSNGNSRIYEETDEGGNVTKEEGIVHYLYKIPREQYLNSDGKLGFKNLPLKDINTVDLNSKYFAYIIGDFDLQNNKGEVRHEPVAEYVFKSATLSSLGNIYIQSEVSNITAHTANILFTLNTGRTNDYLTRLLSDVEFSIETTNGAEPSVDSKLVFDSTMLKAFTGYYRDADGKIQFYNQGKDAVQPADEYSVSPVMMDSKYFDASMATATCPYYLNSMTDYKIVPTIYATYNGKKYDMKVTLTQTTFKTMREPANVDVQNVLLAAGTLRFDVHIEDIDEAITGVSSDKVIMNLYDENYNFVRAVRYVKNQYDEDGNKVYYSEEITGLDSSKRFYMNFIAPDYNEGYDNSTYVSNKLLLRYDVKDIIDIKGTVKLHGLDSIDGNANQLMSNLHVDITDNAAIMNGASMPYYLSIEKDGVDISASYPNTAIGDYTVDNKRISETNQYIVDKGDHTYKVTLYIVYKTKKLILDTLTFTTEDIMIPINSAEDFYTLIKVQDADQEYNGVGVATRRYCVTTDLNLGNCSGIPKEGTAMGDDADPMDTFTPDTTKVPVTMATTFNGEIDFQGFTVKFDKSANKAGWFTNIGPKAEIHNLVLECESSSTANIHDKGLICERNYGHIHDIYIHYKGGNALDHDYYGLVTRYNTVSGIIENFVVHSDAEGNYMPFTVYQYGGLICANNQGVVRYGYVYGADINTAKEKTTANIYVGGIVGDNTRAGQIYDVYSSVNIIVDKNISHGYYGSVVGYGGGQFHNAYNTGVPVDNLGYPIDSTGSTIIGSVSGYNKKSYRKVCYWNENNTKFKEATYQQRVSLENINDYSWQQDILESHFNVQPVEVGYYPHVIWSTDDMPQQEYVPLPKRTSARVVELLSSEVISYSEDGNSAEVEFRFSNTRNAVINGLDVSDLTVTLDLTSAVSEDGFTTMRGTLSDPKKFLSSYEVNSINCNLNGSKQTVVYDGSTYIKPTINVDFYRIIKTAEDWYNYVVLLPNENARLGGDIDFTGQPIKKIRVDGSYNGKLDGGKVKLEDGSYADYGYCLKNINFTGKATNAYVFTDVYGSISNVCIDNYTNTITERDYMGFVYRLFGTMENVHMSNVSLTGYGFVAPVVCRLEAGSFLQNSSVNGLKINYIEKANYNSTAYVGGLVGYMTNAKIQNCYAAGIDIQVNDVKSAEGVGGIVGRVSYGLIENVYAAGDIVGRCLNVGGIVGYYESDNVTCDIKNVVSRVNVTSHQDAVGGVIGQLKLTNALINPRNNISGIAYGNVNCGNNTSENVSYTIGYMSGSDGALCGSDFQLINGIPGQVDKNIDSTGKPIDHTHLLINYDQAITPSTYTDSELINMDSVYDFNEVTKEYIPKLYYAETNKLLPFQPDIRIVDLKVSTDILKITKVSVNKSNQYIDLTVAGPARYRLYNVNIDLLNCYELNSVGHTSNTVIEDNGETLLRIYYRDVAFQQHFLDSYLLKSIAYETPSGTTGVNVFNTPVSIPLMLFGKIDSIEKWNSYLGDSNQAGNYENYEVTTDLDFNTNKTIAFNAKVGRLRGVPTGKDKILISGLNVNRSSTNLIFRINSELSNFEFDDISIISTGRDGSGIVGTSAGNIKNVGFKNVHISSMKNNYAGLIAWQFGSAVEDITMENIEINSQEGEKAKRCYMGGLIGQSNYGTVIRNVNAKKVNVYGDYYVGGIVGYIVGSLEKIACEDMIVTGCRYRVGGIAGGNMSARQTNGNSAVVQDLSIKGTVTKDAADNIINSTTIISLNPAEVDADNSYDTGGLIGYCGVYVNGFDNKNGSIDNSNTENPTNAKPHSVDGVIVKGYGHYIGGAFGRCTDVANTKVSNTLVGVIKDPAIVYNYMGAVSGYVSYSVRRCDVDHCEVRPVNHGRSGIMVGYHGSTLQYCYLEESLLSASSDKTDTLIGFGGISGYSSGQVNYSLVKNIKIDANGSNMETIGGAVGYMNNQITAVGVYSDLANADSPTAKSDYYISGNKYVGGVAGRQYASTLLNCYSNANVKGKKYIGGVLGRYENNYTATVVSGTTKKSYSSITFRGNYFAGTVDATDDYAGGLIGSLGLTEVYNIQSGREKNVTGSYNEVDLTYRNLMVGASVRSANSNAYAFAGNLDGFEGKANYSGFTGVAVAANRDIDSDAEKVKYARSTMFWDCSEINGIKLDAMNSDSAPAYAKNINPALKNARYAHYAGQKTVNNQADNYTGTNTNGLYAADDGVNRSYINCRVVSSKNMECANMYWSMYLSPSAGSAVKDKLASYGFKWVILSKDITQNTTPYTAEYRNTSYLPQVRVSTDSSSVNDYVTRTQVNEGFKLPVPQGTTTPRSAVVTDEIEKEETYGILYLSDVDRVNLEFGEELVDKGYYVLKCNGKVVDSQIIKQRVYTYSYDAKAGFELIYGYADLITFKKNYFDYENDQYFEGVTEEMIFDEPNVYLSECDRKTYKTGELKKNIMTYGNKYYYIDQNSKSLVSGCGSTVLEEDGDRSRIIDSSAEVDSDKYLSIYNGHALMEDGRVIDIESKDIIRKATKDVKCLNNTFAPGYDESVAETLAFQKFKFNDTPVTTYHKFTDYNGFKNSGQFILSTSNELEIISEDLNNIKDAVVIYTKYGSRYCTIVDDKGFILDMHHGASPADINAPEDMKMSGIISMTNNMNCTAPFVLVQYASGGIVGFNYMTGEYLFNNYVNEKMDLLDYVKVYFDQDKSDLEDMYATYPGNKQLADIAVNSDRLNRIVNGFNSDSDITNQKEDETAYKDGNTDVAKDGSVTGDNVAIRGDLTGKEEIDGERGHGTDAVNRDTNVPEDGGNEEEGVSLAEGVSEADGEGGAENTNGESHSESQIRPGVSGLGLTGGIENAFTIDEAEIGTGVGLGDTVANGLGEGNGDKKSERDSREVSNNAGIRDGEHLSSTGSGNGIEVSGERKEMTGSGAGTGETGDHLASTGSGTGSENTGKHLASTNSGTGIENTGKHLDSTSSGVEVDDDTVNEHLLSTGSGAGSGGSKKDKNSTASGVDSDDKSSTTSGEKADTEESEDKEKIKGDKTGNTNNDDLNVSESDDEDELSETDGVSTDLLDTTREEENEETTNASERAVKTEQMLMVVYNAASGTYEIIDLNRYMNDPTYVSENARLAVHDLTVYSDYHAEKTETKKDNGLWLYMLAIIAVLGGIGGGFYYKKKHNMKV